jgi:hypothetical protein
VGSAGRRLFVRQKYILMFDLEAIASLGASADEVLRLSESYLEQQPGVAQVWRRSEIFEAGDSEPIAAAYGRSLAEGRDADLVIQPEYGCMLTKYPTGTSHGSPYDYDRAVPLIFFGAGVEAGQVPGPAATVDIAPTAAALMGIAAPMNLDGSALRLRGATHGSSRSEERYATD